MKYLLFLPALFASACGAEPNNSSAASEAEEFAVQYEQTLGAILGGEANLARLRENARVEQDREANPKPVWDTDTHDAIYELWEDRVWSMLLNATFDYMHDDLLDLKLSERRKLDKDCTEFGSLVEGNHEDFAGALDLWPDLKLTLLRMLDAEDEQTRIDADERIERDCAGYIARIEGYHSECREKFENRWAMPTLRFVASDPAEEAIDAAYDEFNEGLAAGTKADLLEQSETLKADLMAQVDTTRAEMIEEADTQEGSATAERRSDIEALDILLAKTL